MKNGIAIAGAALTALVAGLAAWQMPSTAVADGSRNGTDYKVDADWPKSCPTTGSSARSRAWRSIATTTSGSSSAPAP